MSPIAKGSFSTSRFLVPAILEEGMYLPTTLLHVEAVPRAAHNGVNDG